MECFKCKQLFKSKYNLKNHLNRKIPCDLIYKCNNCNKEFITKQNLNKHLNRKNPCINTQINYLLNRVQQLEEQVLNDNINNRVHQLEEKITNNIINNSTVNSNNTTNNITLNIFGSEDIDHINKKFIENKLKQILRKIPDICIGKNMKLKDKIYPSNYIEFIDLNKMFIENIFLTKPENKTIKIEDNKSFINNQNGWEDCEIEEIADSVLNTIENLLMQLKESNLIQKTEIVKIIENNIKTDRKNGIVKLEVGKLDITNKRKKLLELLVIELIKDPNFIINHSKNII